MGIFFDLHNQAQQANSLTDPMVPMEGQEEPEQDEGIFTFDNAFDVAVAPLRGALSAVEGIAEIGNIIPGVDYDIPDNIWAGNSKTIVGGLVEGFTQFLVPFMGVGGTAASMVGRLSGVSQKATQTAIRLAAAGKHGRAATVKFGMEATRGAVGGALVDFAFFDGLEGRLSDLANKANWSSNSLTEMLATEEDDSQLTGRLKNMAEGAMIGGVIDSLLYAVKAGRIWHRNKVKAKGDTEKAMKYTRQDMLKQEHAMYQQEWGASEAEATMAVAFKFGLPDATAIPHRLSASILEELQGGELRADMEDAMPRADEFAAPREVDEFYENLEEDGWLDDLMTEYMETGQAGASVGRYGKQTHSYWFEPGFLYRELGHNPQEVLEEVTPDAIRKFAKQYEKVFTGSAGNKYGIVIFQEGDKNIITIMARHDRRGGAESWSGMMGGGRVIESHHSGDLKTADWKPYRSRVKGIPLPKKGQDIVSLGDKRRKENKPKRFLKSTSERVEEQDGTPAERFVRMVDEEGTHDPREGDKEFPTRTLGVMTKVDDFAEVDIDFDIVGDNQINITDMRLVRNQFTYTEQGTGVGTHVLKRMMEMADELGVELHYRLPDLGNRQTIAHSNAKWGQRPGGKDLKVDANRIDHWLRRLGWDKRVTGVDSEEIIGKESQQYRYLPKDSDKHMMLYWHELPDANEVNVFGGVESRFRGFHAGHVFYEQGDITIDRPFHVGNARAAADRGIAHAGDNYHDVAAVTEFEVNPKNPLVMGYGDPITEDSAIFRMLDDNEEFNAETDWGREDIAMVENELGFPIPDEIKRDYSTDKWHDVFVAMGYDGVPYFNKFEDQNALSWMILQSSALKVRNHRLLQYKRGHGSSDGIFRYRQAPPEIADAFFADHTYGSPPSRYNSDLLFHRSSTETAAEARWREDAERIASMGHKETAEAVTSGELMPNLRGVLRPIGEVLERAGVGDADSVFDKATLDARLQTHATDPNPVTVQVDSKTLKPIRKVDEENLALAARAGDDAVNVVYIPPFESKGRRLALRIGSEINDIPEVDLSNPLAVSQWVGGLNGQRAYPDHNIRYVDVLDLDGTVSRWDMERGEYEYGASMIENYEDGIFDPAVAKVREAIDDGDLVLRLTVDERTGTISPSKAEDALAIHMLENESYDGVMVQWEVRAETTSGKTGTGHLEEGVSANFHGPAGAFDVMRHLIYVGQKEDGIRPDALVSLLIHERGHAIRHILLNPRNGHFTLDQVEAIEAAFGVKDGIWTEAQEEKFAEAFVHFFRRNLAVPSGDDVDDGVRNLFFSALAKKLNETGDLHQKLYLDPDAEIPKVVQDMFNELANKSDFEAVAAAVGTDAVDRFLNRGARPWLLASSQSATKAEQRMEKFRQEMNGKYGDKWESDPFTTLDERDARRYRTNLTILDNEDALLDMGTQGARPLSEVMERQAQAQLEKEVLEDEIMAIAEVSDLKAVRLRDIPDPTDRAAVKDMMERLKEVDSELKLYEEKLNPRDFEWERANKAGIEGAKRPRNQSSEEAGTMSALKRVDDMDSYERGLDMFSDDQRMMEEELREYSDEIKQLVMEKEAKYVAEFFDATGNPRDGEVAQRFLAKVTNSGIKFVAGLRVIRHYGNAVVMKLDETIQELRVAMKNGDVDKIRAAKSNFIYYYGYQKELMRHMKANERLAGMALQSHNKAGLFDGMPVVKTKLTDPALQQKMIDRFDEFLTNKGLDFDTFMARVEAVVDEGVLGVQRGAAALHQSRFDPFMELWYNSLLSGPRTQRVNFDGNIIWGILNKFSRSLGRRLTGSDQKTVGLLYSVWHNHKAAWRAAVKAFKHGTPQLDPNRYAVFDSVSGAFDGTSTISSGRFAQAAGIRGQGLGKPAAALVNGLARVIGVNGWPTKLLGATDEYFKQIHYRGMVRERLLNDGLAEGLEGAELARWIDDEFQQIMLNGTKFDSRTVLLEEYRKAVAEGYEKGEARDKARKAHDERYTAYREEVSKKSLDYARFSTFTNENAPGFGDNPISRGVQRMGRGFQNMAKESPWMRLFVPFINTPANLLSIASDYAFSPIFDTGKFANRIGRNLLKKEVEAWGTADDRALGRLVIASTGIATIGIAAASGVLSGGGPTDPARRKTLMESGWQPYSIKVDDKWISYGRLDPVASVVSIVADIVNTLGDDPYLSDPDMDEHSFPMAALYALGLAVGRNLKEKSFLAGFIKMNAAISNPEFYSQNIFSDLGATFVVPNLVNQISQDYDPTLRETRNLMDKIRYRTPLRHTLDPQRNVLGEPLKGYDYSMGGLPFSGLANPYAHSTVTQDPVRRELAMYGKGITPPQTTRYGQVDMEQYKNRSGRNAYDRWLELHGSTRIGGFTLEQALRREMGSSRYRNLAPVGIDGESSPRMDALKKIIFRYRAEALKRVQAEFPTLGTNLLRAQQNAANRRLGAPEQALLELLD